LRLAACSARVATRGYAAALFAQDLACAWRAALGAATTLRCALCSSGRLCCAAPGRRRLVRSALGAPFLFLVQLPDPEWRRTDVLPPAQSGGAEYLSVTVFEGATPLDLVEFFCDDAHRMTWCVRGHFKPSR
jgi:hypothetical protein